MDVFQFGLYLTNFRGFPGPKVSCFYGSVFNSRLVYDEKTNTVKNAPGVETRVPGFGDTATVEYVDTTNLIGYFKPMVDALVSWGYERGVSVRAAPYDFRYAPGT